MRDPGGLSGMCCLVAPTRKTARNISRLRSLDSNQDNQIQNPNTLGQIPFKTAGFRASGPIMAPYDGSTQPDSQLDILAVMLMVIFGAGASYDSAQAYRLPRAPGGTANFGIGLPATDPGGPWRPP